MKKHETMTKRVTGTGVGAGIPNRRKTRQSKGRNAAPRTILVPIDFSDGSQRALSLADSLAAQFNSVLVLVHVLDPIYTPGRFDSPRLRPLRAEARQDAESRLGKLAQISTRESKRPMKHHVIDGVAPDAILAFAKKAKADWIVMGSKGQTGVKRLLAGSVAERVVRQATCPVLVAP